MGQIPSAIVVCAMILLSVGTSYVLDHRSNQEVEALGKRVQSRVFVLRNGHEQEIKISDVVPGDIVLLHSGSIVPADLRLIFAKDFFLSESALTGESMPVEKNAAPAQATASALALQNACFMGTSVTSGTAKGVVVNTGMHTVFWCNFRTPRGKAGRDQLRQGYSLFHPHDDALEPYHGVAGLHDRRHY